MDRPGVKECKEWITSTSKGVVASLVASMHLQ